MEVIYQQFLRFESALENRENYGPSSMELFILKEHWKQPDKVSGKIGQRSGILFSQSSLLGCNGQGGKNWRILRNGINCEEWKTLKGDI